MNKWNFKSNGLNFFIYAPGEDCRTVAECHRREDAQLICDMRNDGLTTVDRMKAYADTTLADLESKIENELRDTESAISALEPEYGKNWADGLMRYRILSGHKAGLEWVKNRIREMLS